MRIAKNAMTRTVQMTLDDALVAEVDRTARRLGLSRSAFTRRALREALEKLRERELERKQRAGYAKRPVRRDELGGWEREQAWGDEW